MIFIFKIPEINKLRQVHFALVESIISYCIVGRGGAFNNVVVNLKTRQNSILRVVLKKEPMYLTNNLYKELNVLKCNIFKEK